MIGYSTALLLATIWASNAEQTIQSYKLKFTDEVSGYITLRISDRAAFAE